MEFELAGDFGKYHWRVKAGIVVAEKIWPKLIEEVALLPVFEYSNLDGKQLAEIMKNGIPVHFVGANHIPVFKYKNWFTRALAYTTNYSRNIKLNYYKMRRSPASIAGILCHESTHILDYYNEKYYFGHGDNKSKNKGQSAPYLIGKIAKRLAEDYLSVIVSK